MPRGQRVDVELVEGARMVARVGDHTLTIDFPEKLGGTDTAPTPTELFCASIAACELFYAHRYLSRRDVQTDGAKASIEWRSNKKHIEEATVQVEIPGGIDPAHVENCLEWMHRCFVGASVRAGMEIRSSVA